GDVEKEQFVRLMRLYEAFCGVRVLSFCVMSNHFHILVEVPPSMEGSLSDGCRAFGLRFSVGVLFVLDGWLVEAVCCRSLIGR
ncbi:MAG: transposase, partial [Methylococcales bacterium]|nr:transposase [Methylococcales bacterium]